jgi:hypothetical protein
MDARAIYNAVVSMTKKWTKQRTAEERQASREERRRAVMTKSEHKQTVSLVAAIFRVMQAAIAAASGLDKYIFPGRNLFYNVREMIQEFTSATLKSKYFDKVIKQYEKQHGPIPGMYRDPRGYLLEPHSGKVIPLGTREVEAYQIPAWQFNKLLYVEKKGFVEIFREVKLAERYDMAIICAEGYATNAAKLLLSRAERSAGMIIFCLHDADPDGYYIVLDLRGETRQGNITVIDFGLTIEEALAMGLKPEVFPRVNALRKGLILNEIERQHFEGVPCGRYKNRQKYRCQRVELNALAANPDRFIEYVEGKLLEHGCGKLVPPKKVVIDAAKAKRTDLLMHVLLTEVMKAFGVSQVVDDLFKQVQGNLVIQDTHKILTDWAEGREPNSWRLRLDGEMKNRVAAITPDLVERAKNKVAEILGKEEDAK